MTKFSVLQLLNFENKFFAKEWPEQRYGQAACNHFGITDPLLFYEPNREKAAARLWSDYWDNG